MSSEKITLKTFVVLTGVLCISGCIPEDSLEWSADGSLGLLKMDEALYLVDGQNGGLTEIAKANVQAFPAISHDGDWIAYSETTECSSLSEGLELLATGQAKMIKSHAELMKDIILSKDSFSGEFPTLPMLAEGPLEGEYLDWVIRYMCEEAGAELAEKLGSENIEKGKKRQIEYFELIVAPRNALNEGEVVAVSALVIWRPRFSPDGRYVAYLVREVEKPKGFEAGRFDLFIASPQEDIRAMAVASYVGLGYGWRRDGRAIAFLQALPVDLGKSSIVPAILKERIVADANDNLLAGPVTTDEQGSVGSHRCTGKIAHLVGGIFHEWAKVSYGPGGRMFFSNAALCLPISLEEPEWSLFCFDPATRAVASVLPSIASDFVGANVNLFALSPDGTKVLLPMENNRFGIYEFATASGSVPVEEDEGFSSDGIDLPSAWKGNDEISCLVAENSHLLVAEGQAEHRRKEVVIIGADGEKRWTLSGNWPDEIMGVTQQAQDPNKPAQ
jgi:hypothetical protein